MFGDILREGVYIIASLVGNIVAGTNTCRLGLNYSTTTVLKIAPNEGDSNLIGFLTKCCDMDNIGNKTLDCELDLVEKNS